MESMQHEEVNKTVGEYHIGIPDAKLLECVYIFTGSHTMDTGAVAFYAALTGGRPYILRDSNLIDEADERFTITPLGMDALNYFHRINGRNFY